ncbi:class I SAM-dependent RNA methyltransferase [Corynebacterium epidermidicanis]|uniref:SAM-dependent methyltransferase, tRNA(Uracil-5)-methyltransferase n=1 Tax=Corynebacterium epidermidicanis TaxID=1050174 RepID=A0A0G3GQ14_9CORY|nr:TRAM domain-containing protein [Corynebacterium epidermidicanis]AKK03301.1 SAM-dependent methyltransferase, tRNA(uracil-5)-methyltransferase [Corynebacterium epidermidicanis]
MENPSVGQQLQVTLESPAHGGESVARTDGLVIFVPRTVPGDVALVELTEVKKRFARARVVEILEPGPGRVADTCAAAAHGAGCCDYSFVSAEAELELKAQVLREQLERIGKLTDIPEIETVSMAPASGWRTRFRLGVDKAGRAGIRAAQSNELVTDFDCRQAAEGALSGILGSDAQRFTPGAEIVVALDSNGDRHVVETSKAGRGKTARRTTKVIDGSGSPVQRVGEYQFTLPAVSFWQAHKAAPEVYSEIVSSWIEQALDERDVDVNYLKHAWDLYGGVGFFIPAMKKVLPKATVHSVELAPQAAKVGRETFGNNKVDFVSKDVFAALPHLPKPGVVVLDPPRKGAGADTVARIAAAQPEVVIHVGCDPATFARDLNAWYENGYYLEKLSLCNAFPGTHHSESFGLLLPVAENSQEDSA